TAPTEEPPFEIPPVAPPAPPSPVEPLDLSTIPYEEPSRDFADRDDTMRGGKFRVSGGLFEVESPDGALRNVVVFQPNPLVRVAVKRAFGKFPVKILQSGSLEDARASMTDLMRANRFFVTFLENIGDETVRLMQQIKRRNARLPVVIIDAEPDLRRRHDLLKLGADLYLTKPAPE